jgi:hypothetical protein
MGLLRIIGIISGCRFIAILLRGQLRAALSCPTLPHFTGADREIDGYKSQYWFWAERQLNCYYSGEWQNENEDTSA